MISNNTMQKTVKTKPRKALEKANAQGKTWKRESVKRIWQAAV